MELQEYRTIVFIFFSLYKELFKIKYESERHIAAKCNNMKMLEAKWKPVLNCNFPKYIGM